MRFIITLFILFIIYSFIGWCMEVIVTLVEDKKLINRGFLIGPLCPIYGVGVTLINILLVRYREDPFTLYIMAVLICSILEYFTSYMMEKIFKARWWDYSNRRFNINGRICLENLIAFGLLGLLITYIVNPFFTSIINKIPFIALLIISIIIIILFMIDIFVSFKVISGFKNVAKSIKKDSTEEITKKVRELLLNRGGLYKRLILAFKNFEASERLLRLREKVKETASNAIERLERENQKIKKTKNKK